MISLIIGVIYLSFALADDSPVRESLTGRIMGGTDVGDGDIPYQVSLRYASANRHFCGGSIINERWIITAAHCLTYTNPARIIAVAGTNKLNSGGDVYRINYIKMHEKFNPTTMHNDIALIRVDGLIKFYDKVQPVPINNSRISSGTPVVVSGWGFIDARNMKSPNELQELRLEVISQDQCQKGIYYPIISSQICTSTKYNEGVCRGDSGGPLVKSGVLVGLVSYGEPCGTGYPEVFTKVSSFISWINKSIENADTRVIIL